MQIELQFNLNFQRLLLNPANDRVEANYVKSLLFKLFHGMTFTR